MQKNINTLVNKQKKEFNIYYNKLIKSILPKTDLSKAMIYGSINGGKRIRPFIISIFSNIAGINKSNYLRLSSAVESIHSYSLIHDDLPSMDNDDYRRGKLSVHRKFNEATAILAGDALHDLAFELISNEKTHKDSNIRIALIKKLSIMLGSRGLAGGQSLDLLFENKRISNKKILNMYQMKTSSLFNFCCSSPFILANKKNNDIKFAEKYGNLFGLIFQITDDVIDNFETFKKLGKTPGKDERQGKSTFIVNNNKEATLKFCKNQVQQFEKNNKKYFKKWRILKDLLDYYLIKLEKIK